MKALFKSMQGKASLLAQTLVVAVVMAVMSMAMFAPHGLKMAFADTTNYPPGTSVYTIPIHLSGTYSSALSSVAAVKLPYKARLVGFTGAFRTYSGTGVTHNVDLRAGATSVLSAPLTLSSVVAEATVATAAIADETTMFVDWNPGVSGVSATDMTLLMTVVR